ncbi:unnamed protein product, partial [Ectocarpus sp. 12 AP-2014]
RASSRAVGHRLGRVVGHRFRQVVVLWRVFVARPRCCRPSVRASSRSVVAGHQFRQGLVLSRVWSRIGRVVGHRFGGLSHIHLQDRSIAGVSKPGRLISDCGLHKLHSTFQHL